MSDHLSENRLIQEAKTDPDTFGKLYDLYYPRVLNFFLRRTGEVEVAADLTADTFYAALRRWKNFQPRHNNSFSAWIFKIANNLLSRHYRSFYRLPVVAWILAKFDPPAPEIFIPSAELKAAEAALEQNDRLKKMRAALQDLKPRKYQLLLSLFYFDNLSVNAIAATLNMSENSVKTGLHRARTKLKTICHEV